MKKWERGIDPLEMCFSSVAIWVQLWGLPIHCRTRKMGCKLGECLGKVIEADNFELQGKGTFVKVKVEIDLNTPLMAGVNEVSKKDGVFWVDFRGERNFGPWMKAFQPGRRFKIRKDHDSRQDQGKQVAREAKKKQVAAELLEKLSMLKVDDASEEENSKQVQAAQMSQVQNQNASGHSPTKSIITVNGDRDNYPKITQDAEESHALRDSSNLI
ncbi:hypothetical protein SESBI_09105 [Sesbania bispinosa]|nr:hypothetical protein SESBI_09105 [Sesbania bispinosa]